MVWGNTLFQHDFDSDTESEKTSISFTSEFGFLNKSYAYLCHIETVSFLRSFAITRKNVTATEIKMSHSYFIVFLSNMFKLMSFY